MIWPCSSSMFRLISSSFFVLFIYVMLEITQHSDNDRTIFPLVPNHLFALSIQDISKKICKICVWISPIVIEHTILRVLVIGTINCVLN